MKRKSLKHRSKRAWIVAGVAAFAGVSLLSTGFAAWVVGITDTTEDGNIGVTVDTTTNSSILLEAVLSEDNNTLRLDEDTAFTGDGYILQTDTNWNADTDVGDFTVAFSSLSVTYDKAVYSIASLSLSITETFSTSTNNSINTWNSTSTNYMDDVDTLLESTAFSAERTASSWTYVDLDTTTIDVGTSTDNSDGTTTTTFASNIVTFKWGTWFNNVSPCNFYNSTNKLSALNGKTSAQKVSASGYIDLEMDELYTEVTKAGSITLSVKVNYSSVE